jgi:hypothetical protein
MVIKAGAARPWGDRPRTSSTWYEPYTDSAPLRRGIEFVLSTPGVAAFCTPGDVSVLAGALDIAQSISPMDAESRAQAIAEMAGEPVIFPIPA